MLFLRHSNNCLSQSPRPPRSPATNSKRAESSAQPSAASSRENISRLNDDGDVPRTEGSPDGNNPVVDGVRQKVSVDVEPTPDDVRVPPSTSVSDSIILIVPDLATTTATTTKIAPAMAPGTSSLAGASDAGAVRGPVNCLLLSTEDTDGADNVSQPTISISLDSLNDDDDDAHVPAIRRADGDADDDDADVPVTSSSSAESISHILSSTQLSVDPRSYYVHNGPMNRGGYIAVLCFLLRRLAVRTYIRFSEVYLSIIPVCCLTVYRRAERALQTCREVLFCCKSLLCTSTTKRVAHRGFILFLRAKAATALAHLSHRNFVRLSVCPSVRYTGKSVKNGASYDHQIFTIGCLKDSSFRNRKAFS